MNFKLYDCIGKTIEVINSRNKSLIGMKDIVVDETKNTIVFNNGKKILKKVVEIKIIE